MHSTGLALLLLRLLLYFCSTSEATTELNDPESAIDFDGIRLPTTINPLHYVFTIKAYVPGYQAVLRKEEEFTFEATVRIKLYSQKPADTIILNAYKLQYLQENCYVRTEKNKKIKIKSIISKNQKVAFVLESKINKGFSELVINYKGYIVTNPNDPHGIYRTEYTGNNTTIYGVITQFEMNHARKMVPCFDEPSFKARWTVEIIHPKGTTALSNQIETGEPKELGDFLRTRFKTTVRMSSYLLAISISDFQFIEGYTDSGVRMRVWLEPSVIDTANFALNAAIKCLEGMEKLYEINYPMKKIDMIQVSPYYYGGMENYGLITFRNLSYKEGVDHYAVKERMASVIAHELGHQWFGNLVTTKWWDNLWLNEAFASYTELAGKQFISNGIWDTEDTFVISHLEMAFTNNGLPLQQPNNSSWERLDRQLSYIYEKGASVLAMIRHLFEDEFDQAIRAYLKTYSYRNVDHNDLLEQLSRKLPRNFRGPRNEVPFDIHQFAKRWIEQPGYTVLSVEEFNVTSVLISQNNSKGYKWDVPLWIQDKDQKYFSWLPHDQSLTIHRHGSEAFVLNYDSYAVARVNYTKNGWGKVLRQLQEDHTIYSDRTKYRIISDLYALSGKSDQEIIDLLAPYLVKEKAFLPWSAVVSNTPSWNTTTVPQFLIDVLSKDCTVITDDASYMENRVKNQQRSIYCRIDPNYCKGQTSADYIYKPMSAPVFRNRLSLGPLYRD